MNENQTVCIWHENLKAICGTETLPFSALTSNAHIHGRLCLQFGGRLVPHLGYFGPDDVCINNWIEELWSAAQAFMSYRNARYVFDEGEQGQPAFVFERAGDRAYFSITDSEISDGQADPDWQRVEFSSAEFLAEHIRFRESLFATIRATAPNIAEQWIHLRDPKQRSV